MSTGGVRDRTRPAACAPAILILAMAIGTCLIAVGASADSIKGFSLASSPDRGFRTLGLSGAAAPAVPPIGQGFSLVPPRALPFGIAGPGAASLRVGREVPSARRLVGEALSPPESSVSRGRKRPWLAGFEVFGFNWGLWLYSRYIAKEDWAYISWGTVWDNFRNGFEFDDDNHLTNFFMHPYNGLFYYNSARTLGMNYLESSAYTLGGCLMWEMFLENQYPSTNDLITTVPGGIFVGEVAFRMSSLILDDTARGGERAWREILAFLINPMQGLNRLVLGDTWRTSDVNHQLQAPVDGRFSLTRTFVAGRAGTTRGASGTGLALDFLYGRRFTGRPARKPFDVILFNGDLRFVGRWAYLQIDSHALIWGRESGSAKGTGHLIGLFQDFDYLVNEQLDFAGTSLAGGAVSFFPLGSRGWLELRTSAQAGVMLLSDTDNIHYQNDPEVLSEYHYGMGPMAKFEARLAHKKWGWLGLRLNHYRQFSFVGKNTADRRSRDLISVLKAQYGVVIRSGVGLRVEYATYWRKNYYAGYDPVATSLSHLNLSLILGFP